MPLLLPLADLLGWAIAFGLCVIAIYVIRAFFGDAESKVAWIPWLGSKLKGSLHAIEQKLTSELGRAVSVLDSGIARTWYRLAHLFKWIGDEIAANAATLAAVAAVIAGLPGISDWRAFVKRIQGLLSWTEKHAISAAHAVAQPFTARIGRLERYAHSHVGVLDREIGHVITWDIPHLRARAGKLEKAYSDLFKLIKRTEARFATKAFAGAVAAALVYLGLGWLRCNALRNVGRTLNCAGFALIEDFLAIGLEVVVVADLCQIANAIESAAILIEPELDKLVGLSDFLCTAGGASYPSAIVGSDRKGRGGNPTALVAADLAA